MTDRYTPAVGDRLRHKQWPDDVTAEVLAVGSAYLWIQRSDEQTPETYVLNTDWIKVERLIPIPHRYIGIYKDGDTGCCYTTAHLAAGINNPTEVLHIWTDENGVDRIERVKP